MSTYFNIVIKKKINNEYDTNAKKILNFSIYIKIIFLNLYDICTTHPEPGLNC